MNILWVGDDKNLNLVIRGLSWGFDAAIYGQKNLLDYKHKRKEFRSIIVGASKLEVEIGYIVDKIGANENCIPVVGNGSSIIDLYRAFALTVPANELVSILLTIDVLDVCPVTNYDELVTATNRLFKPR